jgi:hypothetical protein
MPWNCHPTNVENLWMLPSKRSGKNGKSESLHDIQKRSFLMRVGKPGEEIDTGLDAVEALKVSFDNILIDCQSLNSSTDAAVLANTVDGVVVVVDAGESRNDEIINAPTNNRKRGRQLPRVRFEQTPLSRA